MIEIGFYENEEQKKEIEENIKKWLDEVINHYRKVGKFEPNDEVFKKQYKKCRDNINEKVIGLWMKYILREVRKLSEEETKIMLR